MQIRRCTIVITHTPAILHTMYSVIWWVDVFPDHTTLYHGQAHNERESDGCKQLVTDKTNNILWDNCRGGPLPPQIGLVDGASTDKNHPLVPIDFINQFIGELKIKNAILSKWRPVITKNIGIGLLGKNKTKIKKRFF